jgi:hypothetical protein
MLIKFKMYNRFIEEIIDMMFGNSDYSYDRIVFAERGRVIGEEIYKIGGYKGLFAVMGLLVERLKEADYSNQYMGDLRELECCFNGICEEFQA